MKGIVHVIQGDDLDISTAYRCFLFLNVSNVFFIELY